MFCFFHNASPFLKHLCPYYSPQGVRLHPSDITRAHLTICDVYVVNLALCVMVQEKRQPPISSDVATFATRAKVVYPINQKYRVGFFFYIILKGKCS